jgi:CubicO group peptidase (beta-lactamase class C family)
VGLLVGASHFDADDAAPISEWRQPNDPRGAITIADLLHMSGGLKFGRGTPQNGLYFTEGDHHTAVYFGAVNVFDYSIGRELEQPPNTVWRYRNCDPLSLGSIVRDTVEAGGGEYLSYPQRELFDKIGARNFVLEVDAWGNFIMTGFDYGTARDWARFGLLHVQDGVFAGRRVLPEGWVDFIRTPAPANETQNYGGLFWLNAGGQYDRLPRDMYWPAGHHGQVVLIIPSREMVIVRIGHSALGGFGPYIADVAHRVLASVEAGDD